MSAYSNVKRRTLTLSIYEEQGVGVRKLVPEKSIGENQILRK